MNRESVNIVFPRRYLTDRVDVRCLEQCSSFEGLISYFRLQEDADHVVDIFADHADAAAEAAAGFDATEAAVAAAESDAPAAAVVLTAEGSEAADESNKDENLGLGNLGCFEKGSWRPLTCQEMNYLPLQCEMGTDGRSTARTITTNSNADTGTVDRGGSGQRR